MRMDTIQILRVLSGNAPFLGVYPSDLLPKRKIPKRPFGLIVNTHPKTLPGEHWLAFYFPTHSYGEFFDSYGRAPDNSDFPVDIVRFLELQAKTYTYQTLQLQHPLAITCGQHCLFYLIKRMKGVSYENILKLYSEKDVKNDQMVKQYVVNMKSGRSTSLCNRYLCMQSCKVHYKINTKS